VSIYSDHYKNYVRCLNDHVMNGASFQYKSYQDSEWEDVGKDGIPLYNPSMYGYRIKPPFIKHLARIGRCPQTGVLSLFIRDSEFALGLEIKSVRYVESLAVRGADWRSEEFIIEYVDDEEKELGDPLPRNISTHPRRTR
jgi:hypothetical protein